MFFCIVFEINAFLRLTQKFKKAAKKGGKTFLCWENSPVHSADTLQVKNFTEIALSHTVLLVQWWGNDFWENSPVDSAHTL